MKKTHVIYHSNFEKPSDTYLELYTIVFYNISIIGKVDKMAASSLKTEQDKIARKLSQSSISDKKENVNTGQKKGQTDFIARNKAAFVKPSSSLTHRKINSATNKENVLSTRKSEGTASRPQLNPNPSNVSSTIKLNANTSGKLAKKRVPDKSDKVDILTGLADHNLIQVI